MSTIHIFYVLCLIPFMFLYYCFISPYFLIIYKANFNFLDFKKIFVYDGICNPAFVCLFGNGYASQMSVALLSYEFIFHGEVGRGSASLSG